MTLFCHDLTEILLVLSLNNNQENLSSPLVFSGVCVTRSWVLCVCFVDCSLSFFFWPLCCLFFFHLRILITPLVSSNSSHTPIIKFIHTSSGSLTGSDCSFDSSSTSGSSSNTGVSNNDCFLSTLSRNNNLAPDTSSGPKVILSNNGMSVFLSILSP